MSAVTVGSRWSFTAGDGEHLPPEVRGRVSTYVIPEHTPPLANAPAMGGTKPLPGILGEWVHLVNEETGGLASVTMQTLLGHRPHGTGRWAAL